MEDSKFKSIAEGAVKGALVAVSLSFLWRHRTPFFGVLGLAAIIGLTMSGLNYVSSNVFGYMIFTDPTTVFARKNVRFEQQSISMGDGVARLSGVITNNTGNQLKLEYAYCDARGWDRNPDNDTTWNIYFYFDGETIEPGETKTIGGTKRLYSATPDSSVTLPNCTLRY